MNKIFAMSLDRLDRRHYPESRVASPMLDGTRSPELGLPDSYGHEVAVVFPDSERQKRLLDPFRDAEKRLPFDACCWTSDLENRAA